MRRAARATARSAGRCRIEWTLKVNPTAREGYALKQGDALEFAVRLVVHGRDVWGV